MIAVFALAVLPLAARAQDTPNPPSNVQTLAAGSLVIPMDNTNQSVVAPFNLRAYGLVNDLLQHRIPVRWAIRAGKAKDDVDFTATAQRIAPTVIGPASVSFRAGPFIVPVAYAAIAKQRIAAYGNNVAVFELTASAAVDIRHDLTFKPLLVISPAYSAVQVSYLDDAGIPPNDYSVQALTVLSAATCVTMASEHHTSDASAVPNVRAFLQSGGNVLVECLGITTYENDAAGHFQTTKGYDANNIGNDLAYPEPDLPYSQFEGIVAPAPGGAVEDFNLAKKSALLPGMFPVVNNVGATTTYMASSSKHFGGQGGLLFYLGGHDYGTGQTIDLVNGRRMFLNAVFVPPTRPAGCGLTFGSPDLSVTKTHAGNFTAGQNGSYTIQISNVGTDSTLAAVAVLDTLPAGLSFVSGAGAGWSFSATGQIVTATYSPLLAAGQSASFTLTVAVGVAAAPTVTNRAVVIGDGDANPGNNVSGNPTSVIIPIDLTVRKTHAATFTDGVNGVYRITVRNVGGFPTTGTTTVVDTLPSGLSYVSGAGAGWSFSAAGSIVTATYPAAIAIGDSAVITLTVSVSPPAVPGTTNAAVVSTPNDTSAANNRSVDVTAVNGVVDLALQKRHTSNFSGAGPGVYTLLVRNAGSLASSGAVTVVDTLPAGINFSSAAGTNWSFTQAGQIITGTYSGPAIAPGDSTKFTLTVTVAQAAVPGVTNSAVVSGGNDSNAGNNRAVDPTGVTGVPDLEMRKRHTSLYGAFGVGTNGTWTLTVVNSSIGATIGAITVKDTLPAGITYVSSTAPPGWSVTTSGQIVTATNPGPLAAGDSVVFTITAAVGPAAMPGVVNTAAVTTPADLFAANDRAVDPTPVASIPELQLVKRHGATFVAGQDAAYTLSVTNVSPGPTSGAITVRDTLPLGLTYVAGAGAGWSFARVGQVVTATNPGPIVAGDSSRFTLTVHVGQSAVASISNSATVSTPLDFVPANDRSTDVAAVTFADLQAHKHHAGSFTDGQNGVYTIVVQNVGTAATFGAITVKDTLPLGLTYVAGAGPGWSFATSGQIVTATNPGPIAAGDSALFTLTVATTPAAVPGVTNFVTVSTPGDSVAAGDRGSDVTTVAGIVDLAIQKRHTAAFTDRGIGVYTLVVRNLGSAATTGAVTVLDSIPAGLSYVSAAGAGWSFAISGPELTATWSTPIAAGDSAKFTLTVAVGAGAVPGVTNIANVAATGDINPANDDASDLTAVTGVVDVALVKRHASTFTVATPGQYLFSLTNTGSIPTTGTLSVVDTLPSGLTYASGSGAGWGFAVSGQIVTMTHPSPIAPGDSLLFNLTVNVAAPAIPSASNSAVASAAGDVNAANNRSVDVVPVSAQPVPDLALTKTHAVAFQDGSPGTWTLSVRNLGTAASGVITVRDTLPAGIAYVTAAGSGWTFTNAGQIVTATHVAPLAIGDSLQFTIGVTAAAAAVPQVTNVAWASTPLDPNVSNDYGSDITAVNGSPDLTLAKRHSGTFRDRREENWTLTVTNAGSGATTGLITVTDSLPPGTTFSSLNGAGWSFSLAGKVVTATNPGPLVPGDSLGFILSVVVDSSAVPRVVNHAHVVTPGDIGSGNNGAVDSTAVSGVVDLAIQKRHTAAFTDGQNGSYTIVVRNTGSAATIGTITVLDTLPAGLGYVSGAGAGWSFANAGGIVTATHPGPIAPGDSLKLSLTVTAGPAAVPAVTNRATVSTPGEVDPSNNIASDPTSVAGIVNLTLDKRHTTPFVVGQAGVYTFVIRNTGSAATTGAVAVVDTLPAGLSFVSGAGAGFGFGAAGAIVTATSAGPIAAGDSASFTLTVNIAPAAFPSVSNSAVVTTPGDVNAADNRDVDPTAITGVPDLTLDKRHTANFVHGQTGTWTLVVRNLGTGATAATTTVVDTLPSGISYVSAAGAGWSFVPNGQVVTATFAGAIAAGDSSKFTISASVGAAAVPGVVNSAMVSTPGDLDSGNDRDTDPTTVLGVPDVVLDKRHTANFIHGQTGTWTLVVRNLGTAATAATTTVVDTLPLGITYVSAAGAGWSFVPNGQVVTATFAGAIAAGDSSRFTITALAGAAAVPGVTNTAHATTPGELDATNGSDSDVTPVAGTPDVTLDKRHTANFIHGQTGTWTLAVRNIGSGPTAGATTVVDTLPLGITYGSAAGAGWSFVLNGQVVTATFAVPIAAGDSSTFTILAAAGAAAVPGVINSAAASTPGDLDSGNDRDTDPTTVLGVPDVYLDKRHTANFVHGQNGTWTFVVTNRGTAATAGATTVVDSLPPGISYVSAAGAGWSFVQNGTVVTATFAGPIAVQDSSSFTLTALAGAAAVPSVINLAHATTPGELDPRDGYDSDFTPVAGTPDVALAKRHTASFVHGQPGTWTLVVTNTGTAATSGATTVVDSLPAGITYVSAAGAGWSFVPNGQVVTATFAGPIAAQDSASFTLTALAGAAAVPGVVNTAVVSTPGDLGSGNNGATDSTTVGSVPDLTLDKRHTALFVHGQNGTWTIVVHNAGTGATTGPATVTDVLPAGVTFVSGAGAGWAVGAAGQTVTAGFAAPIAAGDSASFTITVAVGAAAVPGVTNSASVATPGDLDPANNGDSDVTPVAGVSDLMLEKRHTTTFEVGLPGTYTLVIHNIGTSVTAATVTVVDTLPAGLAFASGAGAGWSFSASGQIVTATLAGTIAAGDSSNFTITVNVAFPAFPGVTNSAVVQIPGDLDGSNDRGVDPTPVRNVPDLTLDKRHTTVFQQGQNATYALIVQNVTHGPSVGAVTVTDTLPAGLTFVAASGTGWSFAVAGNVVTGTYAAAIPAYDSTSFTITVAVGAAAVPLVTNAATLTGGSDTDPADNRDQDLAPVTGLPDLVLDKRHTAPFVVGQTGTWTLAIVNAGTGATTGPVAVVDTLPAGVTFVSAAGAGWGFGTAGSVLTATHAGLIAAGDSAKFTVTASVAAAAFPGVVNTAHASTAGDTDPASDTDTDSTAVTGVADLTIDKRHSADFADRQPGKWTLVVTNLGTGASAGTITVVDSLPLGITFVSGLGAGWNFSASGQVVTATNPGPIAAGDSSKFTLHVTADAAAVPGVVNTARLVGANDLDPSNDQDSDSTAVNGVIDLALDKRHTGPFTDSGTGTWTLVATNVGSLASINVITVTDTLPPGTSYLSGAGANWSFGINGNVVTATYPLPIAPGDSARFDLTVNLSAAAVPAVLNSATVQATNDVEPSNNRDSDVALVGGVPELALDKRHAAPFTIGQPGSYTFAVANLGTAATFAATTVTDTLPVGLTFASGNGAGWTFAVAAGVVTATHAAPIAAADSATFTMVTAVAPAAVPLAINAATVRTAGDPNPADDRDVDPTVVLGLPDLVLDKRHTTAFADGQNGTWTFVVTNAGFAATSGAITVVDSLPTGITYVGGAGAGFSFATNGQVVTATNPGPLAVGDSVTFTLTAHAGPASVPGVINTASVATPNEWNAANNGDADPTAIGGIPDLALRKSHALAFTIGSNGTYSLVVRNHGTAATFGTITVLDTLPAGLTYVGALGAGWNFSVLGAVVTATHPGPLGNAPTDSLAFTLTVAVGAAALPAVTNSAVAITAGESNPLDDVSHDPTLVNGLPDLALDKRHEGGFSVGSTGTYRFVLRNLGTAATTGATTVRDSLPAGLTFVSGDVTGGWSFANIGNVVTATFGGTIAAGDSSQFTIVVAIGPLAVPTVTNSAVAATPGDPDGGNDRDSDLVGVAGLGVLTVSKTAQPARVEIGGVVDYAVTVRNVGAGPLTGTTVSDRLPQGLHYQGGTARVNGLPVADPVGAPGPTLAFALGTLTAGSTDVVTYRVLVGAGAELGTGVNLAQASGSGGAGIVATSNTAAARIEVQGGVFDDEGIIAGKIYTECDCDSNRVQGPEEPGIPGVRVYLEDGSFAITDVEGKYSFNHVRPRLHVVRIDASTLPLGSRMIASSVRHAHDGLSQFADVVKGELHRADFVEASHSDAVHNAVLARRARGELRDPADPGLGHGGAATADRPRGRSLLVLGVIDAGIALHSTSGTSVYGGRDGFGDPITALSYESTDGRQTGTARGALFATGSLGGDAQFTLRYDSEQRPGRRLFRDLDPDRGYDALGDASVHGWEAQSTTPLYLRIDRGASFGMYGDFTTPSSPGRLLGAFTRSLNGGIAQAVAGPLAVQGFAAEGRQHQVVDEFPGQGVSGPYVLTRNDGTLGSETVELLTRDRNQPARILHSEPQLRYVDYTLEPFTGRLLFRRPVPSLDADLNPVSIRATYEVETGTDKFWVYGAEARVRATRRLSVGASASRDEDPLAPRALASADASFELATGLQLTGEFARSDSGGTGIGGGDRSGEAARAELVLDRSWLHARAHGLRVSTGFENPSSGAYPGRQELGLTARAGSDRSTSVFLTALRSEDLVTSARRDGFEAGLRQGIADRITAEVAYRWAKEDSLGATPATQGLGPLKTSSVRGRLEAALLARRRVTVFGEFEQDLDQTLQRRYAFGGDARVIPHIRLYARHENIASFAGPFALNTDQQLASTVIGVTDDDAGDRHVFSEYRMRDAFAGREAQAAIGLRDRWTVARGIRVDAAFERVTILRGGLGAATSVAGGVEYARDPSTHATGRLEFRRESTLERWLASAGFTRKLNRDWSALGRTLWMLVPDQQSIDARSQIGVAWRQTDRNAWNGLARYENKLQKLGAPEYSRRVANIVSMNANTHQFGIWTVSGQVAAKWAHDDGNGLGSSTAAQLGAGRLMVDLGRSFDLGLNARGLASGSRTMGLGAEAGWIMMKNLRLAAGWNAFGFHDNDLSGTEHTDRGPYLNLGFKVDETLFDRTPPQGAR